MAAIEKVERKFDKDKVYLQDSSGVIWPYEALLDGKEGFTSVVPNPSKTEAKTEEKKA